MASEHDAFRARLKRKLGVDRASVKVPTAEESAAGTRSRSSVVAPSQVRSKSEAAAALARLLTRRSKRTPRAASAHATPKEIYVPRGPARPLPAELQVHSNARGDFGICERDYQEPACDAALQSLRNAGTRHLVTHAHQKELLPFELERAAFLDTETTALHGGAGCTVFLIGIGLVVGNAFRVHQIFLRAPGDEAAALEHLLQLLRGVDVLVSFHGKSFDRHRLHARLAMLGFDSPLLDFPHLDLYHIARRFYQGRLPNQRLQTIEREVLAVQREDDLPGSQCPGAWFAHVAGRPSRIGDVFEHNLIDVASLLRLSAHVNAPLGAEASAREWISLAKGERIAGRIAEAAIALDFAFARLDPGSADLKRAEEEQRRLRALR